MDYLFYSLVFALLVVGTVLYFTRAYWSSHLSIPFLYHRLPTTTTSSTSTSFADDIESGLSSTAFDLHPNAATDSGDTRAGLDERAKAEVLRLMRACGLGFDEARRTLVQQRLARNGIAPDGRPRDPKLVSFS